MLIRLKFEGGVHSWEIEGEGPEVEKLDEYLRQVYKDTLEPRERPSIEYGVSASGKRNFTVKGYDVKETLNIAHQLAGGPQLTNDKEPI